MIGLRGALMTLTLVGMLGASPAALAKGAEGFAPWLEGMKQEALTAGISQPTVDGVLGKALFLPKAIELDRKQPEMKLNMHQYLKKVVNKARIQKGREMIRQHRALLDTIGEKYGVQPRFIVALWGIETNFGGNTGGFKIVDALATMAYEGRRADFFKDELIKALKIIDEDHVDESKMVGSWAGAMGQTQFMPSSFLNFAVDENGDGKRDIWGTQEDVFASIANYLKNVGWDDELTWGRKVKLPSDFDYSFEKQELLLAEWQLKGVRAVGGGNLPDKPLKTKLIIPEGKEKDAFLVYSNYESILKWNRSNFFAVAVGSLADALAY
jgi:membrane-bound lytic murein transglycosylase B